MDELTFLLILAGIGVLLLVAMFTYYKHHKKIHDEIQDFNHHTDDIDDVLLGEHTVKKAVSSGFSKKDPLFSSRSFDDPSMPDSFSATKQENFDIDSIKISNDSSENSEPLNDRDLVDGVYINSKRTIRNSDALTGTSPSAFKNTTDTYHSYVNSQKVNSQKVNDQKVNDRKVSTQKQKSDVLMADQPETKESSSVSSQPSSTSVPTFAPVEQKQKSHSSQQPVQTIKVVYEQIPDGVEELIVSHTILTRGDYFSGKKLFHVLQSAGLSFGDMNIFHYPGDDQPETFALFSIANIVEPGTFNLDDVDNFSTPGISMFMRLPTRAGNNEAYEKFIQVAKKIATELDGELCDETRSQLTQQAISYKKEQIKELNFNMAKAEKLAGMS